MEKTTNVATGYLCHCLRITVERYEQMLAADGETGDFYEGKRQAGRYFFGFELPKTGPGLDLLERLARTALDMQDAWF